jgi:hypothetical protein
MPATCPEVRRDQVPALPDFAGLAQPGRERNGADDAHSVLKEWKEEAVAPSLFEVPEGLKKVEPGYWRLGPGD